MDENSTISILVYLLEVYGKFGRIVLSIRENFSAVERDDVVLDDRCSFALKIRVIDSKMIIKPGHFSSD